MTVSAHDTNASCDTLHESVGGDKHPPPTTNHQPPNTQPPTPRRYVVSMQAIVDEVTVFPLLILFLLANDDENGLAILRSARILKVGREVP